MSVSFMCDELELQVQIIIELFTDKLMNELPASL